MSSRKSNRYMRLILNANFRTHRVDMLEKLDWLSVKQLIYFTVIMFIHRLALRNAPSYLLDHIVKVRENHRYPTRRNDEYALKRYTKSTSQNSLFYKGIKLYNEFSDFKMATKINQEKNKSQSLKSLIIAFVKANFPLE